MNQEEYNFRYYSPQTERREIEPSHLPILNHSFQKDFTKSINKRPNTTLPFKKELPPLKIFDNQKNIPIPDLILSPRVKDELIITPNGVFNEKKEENLFKAFDIPDNIENLPLPSKTPSILLIQLKIRDLKEQINKIVKEYDEKIFKIKESYGLRYQNLISLHSADQSLNKDFYNRAESAPSMFTHPIRINIKKLRPLKDPRSNIFNRTQNNYIKQIHSKELTNLLLEQQLEIESIEQRKSKSILKYQNQLELLSDELKSFGIY